jgi:hypothetical protein
MTRALKSTDSSADPELRAFRTILDAVQADEPPRTAQSTNVTVRVLQTACTSIHVRTVGPWHRAAGGQLLIPLPHGASSFAHS